MKFYIDTIEQVISDGVRSEYGSRERKNDENSALTAYYQKLSNVAADLNKGHLYMDIKITNSLGGIIKRDQLGAYVDDAVAQQNEE